MSFCGVPAPSQAHLEERLLKPKRSCCRGVPARAQAHPSENRYLALVLFDKFDLHLLGNHAFAKAFIQQ
jgi:hypothetical protein